MIGPGETSPNRTLYTVVSYKQDYIGSLNAG